MNKQLITGIIISLVLAGFVPLQTVNAEAKTTSCAEINQRVGHLQNTLEALKERKAELDEKIKKQQEAIKDARKKIEEHDVNHPGGVVLGTGTGQDTTPEQIRAHQQKRQELVNNLNSLDRELRFLYELYRDLIRLAESIIQELIQLGATNLDESCEVFGLPIPATRPNLNFGTFSFQRDPVRNASDLKNPNSQDEVPTFVIPAGEDQFEIPNFEFPYHFPPDFFGPGSTPFEGTITCQGAGDDVPDLTIRRLGDVILPSPPSEATIEIEIVALNLTSCQPILVNYEDGSQQLLGTQIIADAQEQPGQMTFRRVNETGGTLDFFSDASLDVIFQLLDPIVAPLDPIVAPIEGEAGIIDQPLFIIDQVNVAIKANDVSWIYCIDENSNFCPGAVNLEAGPDILRTAEEIENEINEKLPIWVERQGSVDNAFRWADNDGDGKLDEEEVTRVLKDANVEVPWWITWSTVSKHLIKKYDRDGDSKLNSDEWNEALK